MYPKQIIIKSMSKPFVTLLKNELDDIPSIRFNYHKINGEYTISIKCCGYYKKFFNTYQSSFYGNYVYLYTSISLLLSKLIISFYEKTLVKRFINLNYFYFKTHEQNQILNIATYILDSNAPIELSKNLYVKRKEKLLSALLENFRNKNHINIDAFINFSAYEYSYEIECIVDKCVELFLSNVNYLELIEFILENWFI